jgi:hypothetical protein
MTKIAPEHLAREAIVYVRQSTAFQVVQNLESQRRQYALAERARRLGWSDVEVIDDDLGRSGGGARRPGFEKLLAAICEGRVVVRSRQHRNAGSVIRSARGWSVCNRPSSCKNQSGSHYANPPAPLGGPTTKVSCDHRPPGREQHD